jgi:probable HAF family extracellular repeat protein
LNSGDTFSRAYGINDSGIVVGQSNGATASPFYYSGGQMQFVGSLGGNYGFASKINAAGQIVGISADQNGVTHAFRYTSGTMTNLGSLSAAFDYSIAGGINSSGDVTGYSTTSASNYDAFLYHAGNLQDLGNLYSNSRGFGINDADYVAGASVVDATGDEHAFLWHAGVMSDLGTTAGAVASQGLNINNLNQIVGTLVFDPSDGTKNHGFVWSNGMMTDLNNLLPANSGWVIRDAQGINDLGQIVGFGDIGGEQHAYLLTPVPEPSTLVLAMAGLLLGIMLRRKLYKAKRRSWQRSVRKVLFIRTLDGG